MVQIPSIKSDSAFEDNISWEDIQGLSWMLDDEFNVESMKKTTFACA